MKNKFTLTISIMLLCAVLLACKFNLGGDNTTSGSPNATNRSTAKSDSANKTTTNSKPNAEKSDSRKSSDDLAASEDASDAESSDSQDYKLEIKRSFRVGEKPEGSAQHGDYTILKELDNGGTMGSLHLFKPREAIFILWDGEVLAGPLTTVEQVEEAYEMLSRQSAAEHETRMDIMRNFPTGRNKRVRVYDKDGNLIREEP